jgi:hypothetical protein
MGETTNAQERLARLAGDNAIDEFTADVAGQLTGRLRAAQAVADEVFGEGAKPEVVLEVYDRLEDACDEAAAAEEESEDEEEGEEEPEPAPRRRR